MKISAYIPCYNNRSTLGQAIASLRAQGPRIDQLLVVDDGSVDGSREVALQLGAEIIAHPTNLGRGAVRAAALRAARNDLVLSCDAGLTLAPDFLAQALEWFEDSTVAGVFGRVRQEQPRSVSDRWRQRHLFKAESVVALNRQASLATGGALLRRSTVLGAGNFNSDLRAGEDAELGERLLRAGYQVVFDPRLATHCASSNTLSELLERYRRWNLHGPLSWTSYRKQIGYSWRVMLPQDLGRHDFFSAAISLLCPHYLFWTQRGNGRGESRP